MATKDRRMAGATRENILCALIFFPNIPLLPVTEVIPYDTHRPTSNVRVSAQTQPHKTINLSLVFAVTVTMFALSYLALVLPEPQTRRSVLATLKKMKTTRMTRTRATRIAG